MAFEKFKHFSRTFILTFLIFIAFTGLIHLIEKLPIELYRIKEIAIEDVDFTDIYYNLKKDSAAIRAKIPQKDIKTKDVVLINTGALDQQKLKITLTQIIRKIQEKYDAKAIGVDILFQDANLEPDGIDSLITVIKDKKVVLAIDSIGSVFTNKLPKSKFGYVNLPEKKGESVREYFYNYERPEEHEPHAPEKKEARPSFAIQLCDAAGIEKKVCSKENVLPLKYASRGKGYYNALAPSAADFSSKHCLFEAIEATVLLSEDRNLEPFLEAFFRNKIVIFGQLGMPEMNDFYNVEDKHSVPTDFSLVNRQPTMPGVVIHANALQMLISGDGLIEVDGKIYCALQYAAAFIFLLMFQSLHHFFGHKEKLRFILFYIVTEIFLIIAITYAIIRGSIALMDCGYHIKLGGILFYVAMMIEFKAFAFLLNTHFEGRSPVAEMKQFLQMRRMKFIFHRKKT